MLPGYLRNNIILPLYNNIARAEPDNLLKARALEGTESGVRTS